MQFQPRTAMEALRIIRKPLGNPVRHPSANGNEMKTHADSDVLLARLVLSGDFRVVVFSRKGAEGAV
jgi:hypothetical protein